METLKSSSGATSLLGPPLLALGRFARSFRYWVTPGLILRVCTRDAFFGDADELSNCHSIQTSKQSGLAKASLPGGQLIAVRPWVSLVPIASWTWKRFSSILWPVPLLVTLARWRSSIGSMYLSKLAQVSFLMRRPLRRTPGRFFQLAENRVRLRLQNPMSARRPQLETCHKSFHVSTRIQISTALHFAAVSTKTLCADTKSIDSSGQALSYPQKDSP